MAGSTARGRPRSFDRDAALDQAIRLFWRKGYEATSVRDLSEELGIGAPSLYNAFGDKKALFTEAVGAYGRGYGGFIRAAVSEEPTAVRAIGRILTEAPDRYTRRGLPRGCLIADGDAGTTDRTIRATVRRLRGRHTRLLADKIDADVAAGTLPAATDAAALADYLMTVLTGLARHARDGAPRAELVKIAAIARTALP